MPPISAKFEGRSMDGQTAGAGQEPAGVADEKLMALIADVGKDWKQTKYYDEAETVIEAQWQRRVWPFIRHCSFDSVIDLACGHGRNTEKLAKISQNVIAIDVNKENTDFCAERFRNTPNVTVRLGDGKSFPEINNNTVSLVYCFDAMVHFDSDVVRRYLKEIYRVLRTSGRAFLHHSAMNKNPTGTFHDTPGWRNFMAVELMAHWAHKEDLKVVKQLEVDWRYDGTIRDCFTLLEKRA